MLPDKKRNVSSKGIFGTANLHIVFWLVKDMSWAMLWKPMGIAMIVPAIGAAIYITWRERKMRSEFFHNMAVVFWIAANAYWMCTEFFTDHDELRYYALIPFGIGLLFIVYYYAAAAFFND